jgi:hypothetical protein
MSEYHDYKSELVDRFWGYQESNFKDRQDLFERPFAPDGRPPVFHRDKAGYNVIVERGLPDDVQNKVLNQIPREKWHKWFHSMASSQALTQSIFGNLIVLNKIDCLFELKGDNGKPLFFTDTVEDIFLEFEVNYLGEPRPTNIDVFFKGDHRVAVECKLTEKEVGPCSAGRGKEECDGRYAKQMGRPVRCLKTYMDIKYWEYIPRLFYWSPDVDHSPCPLLDTYQLVRNILSACVREDGKLDIDNGHAVLLYDERNPAFKKGGDGHMAWETVREALKYPALLQKCTWQEVMKVLRQDSEVEWLTAEVKEKYGL